jgi:hypothetical protein
MVANYPSLDSVPSRMWWVVHLLYTGWLRDHKQFHGIYGAYWELPGCGDSVPLDEAISKQKDIER